MTATSSGQLRRGSWEPCRLELHCVVQAIRFAAGTGVARRRRSQCTEHVSTSRFVSLEVVAERNWCKVKAARVAAAMSGNLAANVAALCTPELVICDGTARPHDLSCAAGHAQCGLACSASPALALYLVVDGLLGDVLPPVYVPRVYRHGDPCQRSPAARICLHTASMAVTRLRHAPRVPRSDG